MLDTLILHIPILEEFCVVTGNLHSVRGDVADYQIRAVPSYFKRALDGSITHGDLFHPYESLPSSYSGMAVKFNAVNVANTDLMCRLMRLLNYCKVIMSLVVSLLRI